MKKHSIGALTLVFFASTLATAAMAADPFVGTWKLNVAKSNANPAPKSQTMKIEAQENGFKWTSDNVEANGKATSGEWSGKYDGKAYFLTGKVDFDTVATKKTGANALNSVLKKGAKKVGTGQGIVSKDGKTLTLTSKLTNAQGQDVSVYDKQ